VFRSHFANSKGSLKRIIAFLIKLSSPRTLRAELQDQLLPSSLLLSLLLRQTMLEIKSMGIQTITMLIGTSSDIRTEHVDADDTGIDGR